MIVTVPYGLDPNFDYVTERKLAGKVKLIPLIVLQDVDEQFEEHEAASSVDGNGAGKFQLRGDFPPYPYRVADDMQELVGDELKILERL